jgi:Flp pilus assembly protein TadB
VLLSDPIGRVLIVAAVAMMFFGMAVMKKMIDIKV